MKKALFYTIAFLCIQVLSSLIVTAVAGLLGHPSPVLMQIVTMALFSVVTLIVFLKLRWAVVSKSYVRSKPWLVLFWAVVAAVGSIIPSVFLQDMLPEWPAAIQQFVDDAESQTYQVLATRGGYIVVCLLAPVVEELVFRGAILRALLQWKPEMQWGMIVLSALFFAVVHLNPDQMPHAFLAGLLLGWMYARTGSVVPGVAFHWANNTITYIIVKLYPNPDMHLVDLFGGSQRSVYMAVGFSLLILLPAIYQLHVWMKKTLPL